MTSESPSPAPETPAPGAGTTPLAFEIENSLDYEWTDRAYEFLNDGRLTAVYDDSSVPVVVVDGLCPRCEHSFSVTKVSWASAVGRGVLGDSATEQTEESPADRHALASSSSIEYVEVDVLCECAADHPGRNEAGKMHGCGIAFRIEILQQGDRR